MQKTTRIKKLPTGKRFKSRIAAVVHEQARDMHEADVMSAKTMREFDKSCLTEITPMSGERIRRIRLRENASQPVFALYLNVTPGVVSQWERDEKRPAGASLKLLSLVEKKGLEAIA
jgi:putative transcriptional regulator